MGRTIFLLPFVLLFSATSAQAPAGQEPIKTKPLPATHQPVLLAPKISLPLISQTKREVLLQALPETLMRDLWLADYPDLDRAEKEGWLVTVQEEEGSGFILRKTGKWFIGERETRLRYREKLYRLGKPAAGLLQLLATEVQKEMEELGEEFVPLDITSLVRTAKYQKSLARVNANAQVKKLGIPPTHVLGIAFDIAWAKMPLPQIRLLVKILDELAADRKVVYFFEGAAAAALHVIALPRGHAEFTDFYLKAHPALGNGQSTK